MNILKTIWNLPTRVWLVGLVVISYAVYEPEPAKVVEAKETTKIVKAHPKPWELTDAYKICYGQLTKIHKANGLHKRDRVQSIKIKETMCKAQAGH